MAEAFEFATAARVVFGRGAVKQAGAIARSFGSRALVVLGARPESAAPLLSSLAAAGVASAQFAVLSEPCTTTIAREDKSDVVVALGGGSAIDVAKAVAALLTNGGEPLDYIEIVGRGMQFAKPGAPCIAIPTTAGTGAEVTKNSVLCVPEAGLKASLRSNYLLPRVAIVDPELTLTLPAAVTRNTGLDALTQCIEPYVSNKANPLTDALCREGMTRAARSLRHAVNDPSRLQAREDMCVASLFGGMCLANAKLGAVHGFAGPLGGMLQSAPHGALCAAVLPHVVRANIQALERLAPSDPARQALARYAEVARICTGRAEATALDAAEWLGALCRDLQVPGLGSYGLREQQIPELVQKVSKASSTKGNPVVLSDAELTAIAKASM
eukprot:m51a1_g6268 hypothetical protein (385) ;mRNA; r:141153-142630